MEKIYKCPKCNERENLHFNYDYSKQHRPIDSVLCNECGEIFDGNMPVEDLVDGNYPEVEGTLALCNDKIWDDIYDEYSTEQYPPFGGPFTNALEFIVWLKQNFKAPERIK